VNNTLEKHALLKNTLQNGYSKWLISFSNLPSAKYCTSILDIPSNKQKIDNRSKRKEERNYYRIGFLILFITSTKPIRSSGLFRNMPD